MTHPLPQPAPNAAPVLQAYLLGEADFEAALALQRRLVYEVAGERSHAALILCTHPPLITVGREGSRRHIHYEPEDLRSRRWRVRWVNRGGGCLLHGPGQLAVYSILALDRFGLGVQAYIDRLQDVLIDVLREFGIHGRSQAGKAGVWVGRRLIAASGIAVRDWVTYYGAVLNINPELQPFRLVDCAGPGEEPMTSIERERRAPLRPAMVRERVLEYFARDFEFARVSLFTEAPGLNSKKLPDALATRS